MIHAIKFSCKYNFIIEEKTLDSIKKNAFRLNQNNSSPIYIERINDELFKILLTDVPSRGIILMQKLEILKYIISELEDLIGLEQ
jgi:tRNA nucleotidyltransferase (CCA-adding enzyme)